SGLPPGLLELEITEGALMEDDGIDWRPLEAQAEALDKVLKKQGLKIDRVIGFCAEETELIGRLSGRLICASCGASYHEAGKLPKKEGICDSCGGRLIKRKDDEPSVIRHRLETFRASTAPVEAYYRKMGLLLEVDASGDESAVFSRIMRAVGRGK
ncbi:MAG: nucleoside monophosphate kinase, partial [Bdellovibrionales bacterium]|nr:nucleoside monophosphate kinase [Bdellovibrionales bacterium]